MEYSSNQTDLARREGEKLASYLWENYVEPYDFPGGIFLIGAGHAFHAVAKLVSENGLYKVTSRSFPTHTNPVAENVYPNLTGIIGFISTNPIRPIYNHNHPWLPQWYKDNSQIFVSRAHSLWKKDGKASKRYGTLVRSEGLLLNEMMKLHEKEVFEWIAEKADVEEDEEDEDEDDDEAEGKTEDEEDAVAVKTSGDTESDNDTRNVLGETVTANNTRGESDGDTIDDPAETETARNLDSASHQFLVPVVQSTDGASGEGATSGGGGSTSTGVATNTSGPNNGGDVYMTTE